MPVRVRKRLSDPSIPPPAMAKPVSSAGRMVTGGYQSENYLWLDFLTMRIDNKREGRDPKRISPEILAAAGHPPRSASQRIKTYFVTMEFERDPGRDRGLRRLRELCLECSSDNFAEVRRCTCIDCPLWAHRLGSNPHNYHKRHNECE